MAKRKRDRDSDIERAVSLLEEHGLAGAVLLSGKNAEGERYYAAVIVGDDPAASSGIVDECVARWDELMGTGKGDDDDRD